MRRTLHATWGLWAGEPTEGTGHDTMGDKGSDGDGEILDIKIADLKATAPHFHTHSSNLAKALSKLKTGLAAAGSPWGTTSRASSSTGTTART